MRALIGSFFKVIGFITVICIIIGGTGLFLAGYWLQAGDEIKVTDKADAIVLLSGSYFRPLYAADLYNQGVAPAVYVSRPIERKDRKLLKSVEVDLPSQEEIFHRLLRKKGVPDNAIRFFGESVISTAQEAEALKEIVGNEPKTLILVTSPYHVRRAKMIFEDILPKCTVLATGIPYQSFPRRWWSNRTSALKTVNETVKIIFYLLGGRFESNGVPAV
ncbi:MAG: YdcF family protein [Desulfobacteraceae bacterium]|nr:YdcF family protein [Desulfobacteraceae bacterium]